MIKAIRLATECKAAELIHGKYHMKNPIRMKFLSIHMKFEHIQSNIIFLTDESVVTADFVYYPTMFVVSFSSIIDPQRLSAHNLYSI